MRSAAVFFSKRHAMRAPLASRRADGKPRRTGDDAAHVARRELALRDRATRPLTRSADHRAYRPRRSRTRPELLVPRGFVPLRTH